MVSSTTKNLGYARDDSGCFTKKPQENPSPASGIPAIPSRISGPSTAPYTRPSSSLSQFELLDQTQASTPFAPTPSTTPMETPLLQPETLPDKEDMLTEHVEPFHGDKEDENPEDFLRSFFRCMGMATDDVRKQQFQYFLQADSIADEWFDDLQPGEKKCWEDIENAFNKHWPRQKAAKKTKEEYEEEITGL